MKPSKIILATAVAACMLTTSAFAANVSTENNLVNGIKNSITKNFTDRHMMRGGEFSKGDRQKQGNPMESLIKAGTITKVQADSIKSAMDSARESQKTMKEVLDGLVTAGTITQTQEDAILKAMPEKGNPGEPREEHKNPMDELVTAGTITQAQEDSIQKAMEHQKDSEKTPKEALDSLVTAGTITQVQEDAVLKLFSERPDQLKMLQNRKTEIQTMLANGKITQDKANGEIAKIDEEINKINEFNALTLEQKKEKLTSEFKTKIEADVKDGRLTQEKADKMLKDYANKLANWDGTGMLDFGMRRGGFGDFKKAN
jgi:Spy/CpxP family protein refolding chaperone